MSVWKSRVPAEVKVAKPAVKFENTPSGSDGGQAVGPVQIQCKLPGECPHIRGWDRSGK